MAPPTSEAEGSQDGEGTPTQGFWDRVRVGLEQNGVAINKGDIALLIATLVIGILVKVVFIVRLGWWRGILVALVVCALFNGGVHLVRSRVRARKRMDTLHS